MHGNKSQSQRRRALARLRARQVRHPGRHRRRLPRDRRRGHHPRDQLRRPRGPRHLRAPHRPHRPRGRLGVAASFVLPDQHQRDAEDRRGPRPASRSSTQAPDSSTPLASTPAMEARAARASTATGGAAGRAEAGQGPRLRQRRRRGPTAPVRRATAGVAAARGSRRPNPATGRPPRSDARGLPGRLHPAGAVEQRPCAAAPTPA